MAKKSMVLKQQKPQKFSTREYNGQVYQDIVVNEIIKINN